MSMRAKRRVGFPDERAGNWYWTDAPGRRLAFVLGGYFALFTIVGRPDNWYWGRLIAPLRPLGGFGYCFRPKP